MKKILCLKMKKQRGWSLEATKPICGCVHVFNKNTSICFTKDNAYNRLFLTEQQRWVNDLLKCKGYILLNDVYEALGMKKTLKGYVTGWVYDENDDTCVDFGICTDRLVFYGELYLLNFNVNAYIF